MMRPLATAEHIHGETARDRLLLPEPTMPLQAQHGVDFLIETLRSAETGHDHRLRIGAVDQYRDGARSRRRRLPAKIGELVIMGGACFELGNVTPAAEFNIHVDPHAAAIVLDSGIPITMMPLDVTHQLLTTAPRLAALRALDNRCGRAVAALLASFERRRRAKFGTRATALHDPSVIAYLLRPALFEGREVNVAIETQSPLTIGMTVVDWWGVTGRQANARFMNDGRCRRFLRAADGQARAPTLTAHLALR